MNEIIRKKINSTKTIEDAIPSIVEAFVEFYGEDERKNIEEKFKNLLVIGYCSPIGKNSLEMFLNKEKKRLSTQMMDEFLNSIGFEQYNKNQLKDIIFQSSALYEPELHNIFYYIEYLNGKSRYKERPVSFLSKFYPNVNKDNIDELIASNSFPEIDALVKKYSELMEEYQKYLDEMKPYFEYIEKCHELLKKLELKYLKNLFEQLVDYFNEEERKRISDELEKGKNLNDLKLIFPKIKNVFGYTLTSEALMSAFSNQSNEILQSSNTPNWQKESIKNDRILYFRNLGLNLGEDYEAYSTNPTAISLTPSSILVQKTIGRKKNYYDVMMREFYESLPEFKLNVERIEKHQLLDKSYGYSSRTYQENLKCIDFNIKKDGEKYVLFPILCMSAADEDEYLDHILIHELNHVYESYLQGVENNRYYISCGWENHSNRMNQEDNRILPEDIKERPYELIDEAINEMIAQEISQIMHTSEIYIFNTKDNAKIKDYSSYEDTFFLIEEFYKLFKNEIIASRKNGNIKILFDKIGKENFEQLNNLFEFWKNNFSDALIYQLNEDIRYGRNTSLVNIYKDLCAKRDNILLNMKEYSQLKTQTN